jgi:hypothetical protein
MLGALFTHAIELSGRQRILLMLPLCLAIAIVYKAIRSENLSRLPAAALSLWVTIVVGMSAVGVGLWVLFEIMV